jgi:hypothetical protein
MTAHSTTLPSYRGKASKKVVKGGIEKSDRVIDAAKRLGQKVGVASTKVGRAT